MKVLEEENEKEAKQLFQKIITKSSKLWGGK